jgi:hypothetical protein
VCFNQHQGAFGKDAKLYTMPQHDIHHVLVVSPPLLAMREQGQPYLRRLDLILAPREQWAFVCWGWTGSTMLERQMREYVKHGKIMHLVFKIYFVILS